MRAARTVLLLGLFALVAAASLPGQIVELVIPQVGVNFTTYSGDALDSETGVGFEAGGKLRVGGRFYVEAGFFWQTSGADVTIPSGGTTTDNLRIQDVSLPVVIGFKLLATRPLAFRLYGGVIPAFPTSMTDNDFGIVKDDLQSTLWSGRVGAGLDLVLLSFDAGYDFGLGDLFSFGPESLKRNDFFIDVGLRFGF